MAIQNRRGKDADFDANKMLPGELAVTTDGTRKVYAAFAPGDAREIAFKDQIPIVGDVTPDKLQEAVNNYLNENPVHAGATEEEAKQIELNRKNIEEINDEVAKTNDNVAQLSNPNLFINGNFQIWSNEESFDVYGVSNEEYTTAICDRWHAKHYDLENEFVITKDSNGILFTSDSTELCYVYQMLDEETFSALQGKILTLSYSYTQDDGEIVEESKQIEAGNELNVFTTRTRIGLTSGCILRWAKLEVGTVQTPCVPDSKEPILLNNTVGFIDVSRKIYEVKDENATSDAITHLWTATENCWCYLGGNAAGDGQYVARAYLDDVNIAAFWNVWPTSILFPVKKGQTLAKGNGCISATFYGMI